MKESITSQQGIVSARGLRKFYGSLAAVDGIDLDIYRQECFGLLGPNGAGKTTTIKMISCFIEPAAGVLEVLGKKTSESPRFIKRRIGILPQEYNLDPDLSVEDNLHVYARYFDMVGREAKERADELLSFMGLSQKKKANIDELSGGMKRRLMVARSLLNRPELLILDEPTTGLDPQSRHQIWESLHQLKKSGTTILITTHYMDEASHLCDRLVIMDLGRIITGGTPRSLIENRIGSSVIELSFEDGPLRNSMEGYLKEKGLEYEATQTHLFVYGRQISALWPDIQKRFGERFCALRMANLEDVFLKLTGRGLKES